jgi:hypothetical protein
VSTEFHNREGQPMRPLGYIGVGPDFEVYRRSEIQHGLNGWHWQAYSRDRLLDSGDARTRTGLAFALWRARRRLSRQVSTTELEQQLVELGETKGRLDIIEEILHAIATYTVNVVDECPARIVLADVTRIIHEVNDAEEAKGTKE